MKHEHAKTSHTEKCQDIRRRVGLATQQSAVDNYHGSERQRGRMTKTTHVQLTKQPVIGISGSSGSLKDRRVGSGSGGLRLTRDSSTPCPSFFVLTITTITTIETARRFRIIFIQTHRHLTTPTFLHPQSKLVSSFTVVLKPNVSKVPGVRSQSSRFTRMDTHGCRRETHVTQKNKEGALSHRLLLRTHSRTDDYNC